MMKKTPLMMLPLVSALFLSGCVNLAPDTVVPAAPIASAWETSAVEATSAVKPWRDMVTDERLAQLIDLAIKESRDARVSALKVKKLEALYGVARSARVPNLGGTFRNATSRSADRFSPTGEGHITHAYSASLDALAFEVDFFSRVKNLSDAALENYLASEEGHHAFMNALIVRVAALWFKVGADQALLSTQSTLLTAQRENARLVEASYKAGAATELALEQSRSIVHSLEADVEVARRTLATDRSALNLLVGATVPEAWLPTKVESGAWAEPRMLEGTPSEVLLARPDVRAAEANLRAANANIGAARAAFFPRVTLMGSVGSNGLQLSDVFNAGTGVWSFTPSVSIPIFMGGANRSRLKAAEIDRDMAVASYEQTIQKAFKEVADALIGLQTSEAEVKARQLLVKTNERAYTLAKLRYDEGAASFTDVITAEQTYVKSIQGELAAQLEDMNARLSLYNALGGGVAKEGADDTRE